METPLIISREDIAVYVDISGNVAAKRLDPQIRKTLDIDLRKIMGDRFYFWFVGFFEADGSLTPTTPDYIKDLYNGGDMAIDNVIMRNPGLKPVIIHFLAARLVTSPMFITPTGPAEKRNDYSDEPSARRLDRTANEHRNEALAYWELVEKYLRLHATDFEGFYFDTCGCRPSQGRRRPRVLGVSNNCRR